MSEADNKHFIVVDLETLGMYDDAIILSMGLAFGVYGEEKGYQAYVDTGFHCTFDVKEQKNQYLRVFNKDTVEWWQKQSPEAKEILKPSLQNESITKIPGIITSFMKANGINKNAVDLFDRGSFDVKKLAHLIDVNLGGEIPWNYKNVLEITTFLKALGYDRYANIMHEEFPGCVLHNALHDAAIDAYRLEHCVNKILG